MDDLACIRTFVDVVNLGSFSNAARERGTSVSLVARHISKLESRLGVRLINRNTRSQALTEVGKGYYDRVLVVLREINLADSFASSFQTSLNGTLKVAIRNSVNEIIQPALPLFLAHHPKIELEIFTTDGYENIVHNKIDLAIWLGRPNDSSLVIRRIASSKPIVVASPKYFTNRDYPQHPTDLKKHNCLIFKANAFDDKWYFEKNGESFSVPVSGNVVSNSGQLLRGLALDGEGVCVTHPYLVRDALLDGRLKAILSAYDVRPTDQDTDLYVVYAHHRSVSPKSRAFLDFVIQLFREAEMAFRT